MSDSPSTESWAPLTALERRVLGVLVEKQKTSKSADAYPLTLNALTTGCNQKSNRDPILDLTDDHVEETLVRLQQRGLVSKITGGRAERYRHLLYEAWKVSKQELAVLAELLLRGPQTEGDLRGRASRMDEIKDLDELRSILRPMIDRKLIIYLTPQDRRGAILTHGFHSPSEIEAGKTRYASGSFDSEMPAKPASAPSSEVNSLVETRLNLAFDEIEKLKEMVAELKTQLDSISR